MAEFPNLAGVVTKDLVESIGTGKYSASYVNWSRTHQLLRQHAPGWSVEVKEHSPTGEILFRAPVGGYLQLRVSHVDGTVGPWVPQAVMDNRNKDIPIDRIGARDITDTHRRGSCMCLAYSFGLAGELWAKMKLEAGWGLDQGETSEPLKSSTQGQTKSQPAPISNPSVSPTCTEESFREALLSKGVNTTAIDACVEIVINKLNGDFGQGIRQVGTKSTEELNEKYGSQSKTW